MLHTLGKCVAKVVISVVERKWYGLASMIEHAARLSVFSD